MLGPGIVAGASDNDPTTVATVAVVGSTTVYALGWVALLIFPMLAAVQAIAARVGCVTGRGLGELVVTRYGVRAGWLLAVPVLAVALITLAADVKAGAAALSLLLGVDLRWFLVPIGAVVLAVLWLSCYRRIEKFLQFLALAFVAYLFSAFAAHPNWNAALRGSLIPSWQWNTNYTAGALALLGTTLTSYVYIWETVELAEDSRPCTVRQAQIDAVTGALFVVAVLWFILVATGATLGVHHVRVQTAAEAAAALRPVAGRAASAIFGIGLLASALLAVPVLMATSGHIVSSQRQWRQGLDQSPRCALPFYATMTVTLTLAVAISFVPVSPIHILFAASVAGGVGTPVSLVFLLLIARDTQLLGRSRASRRLVAAGWVVTVVVTLFAAASVLNS